MLVCVCVCTVLSSDRMAANFQSSTLSFTLPVSCHICLGKVRRPVICANHHVFCSVCIEMWLKKASRCPTCRVSITEENPCREIIGGTNESDHNEIPSVRKCLRKTRGELLLREYEEEIDGLIRENEELKIKNQSLQSQLKTELDPCSMNTVQTDDRKVDPLVLEEWASKVRAATEVCDKITKDMEKLKEANKVLRSQNVDLVQENMSLKAEVVSRSPKKFGRYTVAALEAEIQQYKRDVNHLKRALERSDQYIEDLESRLQNPDSQHLEEPQASGTSTARPDSLTQQQKIHMMMRSLSDDERASICSNPEADSRSFSRNHSLVFMPSVEHKETGGQKKNSESSPDFQPTTPSSAFRSLTLRSPGIREKKVAFKPASHLRRLDFDDFPSPNKSSSAVDNQFSSLEKFSKDFPSNGDTSASQSVFWGGWQRSESKEPDLSKESSVSGATVTLSCDESSSLQMSSEASMDAAYLDKISELDSMMLDGESSSSRDSQLSLAAPSLPADLDHTLVADPQSCLDVPSSPGSDPVTPDKHGDKEAPPGLAGESVPGLTSGAGRDVPSGLGQRAPSQTDELSFDLLFDSLEHNKAASSHSLSPASQGADQASPSPSSCSKPANIPRERHSLSMGQTTKRKSHSPFNTSSPTKVTKLM